MGRSAGVYETSERRSSSPEPTNRMPATSFDQRESPAPFPFDLFLDLGIIFYPELAGEAPPHQESPNTTGKTRLNTRFF
jgi:hypothetical protein